MEKLNYGTVDLENPTTKQPFVRCNASVPQISDKDYRLTITCQGKEHKWSMYELKRFQKRNLTVCLECAGNSRKFLSYAKTENQWDNTAISNCYYSGMYLREILGSIPLESEEIHFKSYDGEFERSIPAETYYEIPILLAWEMNMRPLSPENGFPLRLIVPGWYGMAAVKWLKSIEVSGSKLEGTYQTKKYNYINKEKTPVTFMKPKSIITQINPQNPLTIKGYAWSGKPIIKVEVSLNNQWFETQLESHGEYGWLSWKFAQHVEPGTYKISSRAYDKTGCQPEKSEYNLYGYGNNHIQSCTINL